MVEPQTVVTLWKYMVHADQQMVAAAATVPLENDDHDYGISFGSVRKLITHCYRAQTRWLSYLRPAAPFEETSPTRDELAQKWDVLHRALLQFAQEQTERTLGEIVRATTRSGATFALPLGLCMLHVSDHATYHRGQLNTLIKFAGGKPSDVMLFSYAKTLAT